MPGDWAGIHFRDQTNDSLSKLEGCIIEYGGSTAFNACVYLDNAHPVIQHNTIRNSLSAGLRCSGTGANNADINCNNFKDNEYGIYTLNEAQPIIEDNNFLNNRTCGVHNAGTAQVNAQSNYWNDPAGPNQSGDETYGNVDASNYLDNESTCISAPPSNSPPFTPRTPSPANGAVNVTLTGGAVTLQWVGGDPNPWDTVTYDVFFGTTDNLTKKSEDQAGLSYTTPALSDGTRYAWQIVAYDNGTLSTTGPEWTFVTQGADPDLFVAAVSRNPETNVTAGDQITFTATISNSSSAGPCVATFYVDFKIDGQLTPGGRKTVSQYLMAGESVEVNHTWTATTGGHTLQVTANSTGSVTESNTGNNSLDDTLSVIPANVTNLQVQSFDTSLALSWTDSANLQSGLTGYKVYIDGSLYTTVEPSQKTCTVTELAAASKYVCKVTAAAQSGESSGTSKDGYTLLDNPTGLEAIAMVDKIGLSWNAVLPALNLQYYRVYYRKESEGGAFSSVAGMTPKMTISSSVRTAYMTGLDNETYYIAVTAVNKSGGERTDVSTISSRKKADTQGPQITNVKIGSVTISTGMTVSKSADLTLQASDPSGISRIEFRLRGELYKTAYSTSSYFTCYLNLSNIEDGSCPISIKAYDSVGNSTVIDYTVTIQLAVPAAPVITAPANNITVNRAPITVTGTAEKDTEVVLFDNNTQVNTWSAVNANGGFSLPLTLGEGKNYIQASARNRTGEGPRSAMVTVTLDTTVPPPPRKLIAESRPGGVVRLSWLKPADVSIKGYYLYRAAQAFSSAGEAVKVSAGLITGIGYSDKPEAEGTYYYRVTSVNFAGTESTELSNMVEGVSDNTPPRALSIQYTPAVSYGETFASGSVGVLLQTSEAVQATPFLSIVPHGGTPLSVALTRQSDTSFQGSFTITDQMPSGTASAVFSGKDLAGNRGTDIDQGGTLELDGQGPAVNRITLLPGEIIKNIGSPVITVTIGLDDNMTAGQAPVLKYAISGRSMEPVLIENLVSVTPEPDDNRTETQAWQAQFTLPGDAGGSAIEQFYFIYSGTDYLGNRSDRILCQNSFWVYQNGLPQLPPTAGLVGTPLPEGKIQLLWNPITGAAGYRLYRKAPGEGSLSAYLSLGMVQEYTDEPSVDGLYSYAITTIRQLDNDTSESQLSNIVEVLSDSVPPPAPTGLYLQHVAQGIKGTWNDNGTEPVTYSMYRDNETITSGTIGGLLPILEKIEEKEAIDPYPDSTQRYYAVVAVDSAGNHSGPSNSLPLNWQLLSVSDIDVQQKDVELPVLSWKHTGTNITYNVYEGANEEKHKLNEQPLTVKTYEDRGYAGDQRLYTIVAVNQSLEESPERLVLLPKVKAELPAGTKIRRGLMNRLPYQLTNESNDELRKVRIKVELQNDSHTITFPIHSSLAIPVINPGETLEVPVMIGGYDALTDNSSLTTTVEIAPYADETVKIIRTGDIDVADGKLALTVLNDEFTRGIPGQVRFTLENTGDEEIEIITATKGGLAPSNEIAFYLVDGDNNTISVGAFTQTVGDKVITLAGGTAAGTTVARIGAGEVFASQAVDIMVPENAPAEAVLRIKISAIHYHTGKDDHVVMQGLSGTRQVVMADTSYFGRIDSISPEISYGSEDIVISGRAINRSDNATLAGAPLDLVISVKGFERLYRVFSGNDGTFNFTFKPKNNESGLYSVYAVHPDLRDRKPQKQFIIQQVSVSPTNINLSLPRNKEYTMRITVKTGDETTVNDLDLVWNEAEVPTGISISRTDQPVSLGKRQETKLAFTISADENAPDNATLYFRVVSDESESSGMGPNGWALITIKASFTEAQPVLFYTPSFVETGVPSDNLTTETVVLENRGLADLENVHLSIVTTEGGSAPSWVYLNTNPDIGTIAVGGRRDVGLTFAPRGIPTQRYDFYLRVTSTNYQQTDILIYVHVTAPGSPGGVDIHVSDIYTDQFGYGNPPGLEGARISLQYEDDATLEMPEPETTNSGGWASFYNLPAGRYKFRVRADKHLEYIGRLRIKPGFTSEEEVFLDYNLVTVEWEVEETTIEDEYEIVLTATYETKVPAPVVVVAPLSTKLPDMNPGDVFTTEVSFTNEGLVRADEVTFTLPEPDQFFTYEILGDIPTSIEADQSVIVPFRITCISSFSGAEEGSGSGCGSYASCSGMNYSYACSRGHTGNGSAATCFTKSSGCSKGDLYGEGSAGGITTGGGGWTDINIGVAGYGGGGGSSFVPKGSIGEGSTCSDNDPPPPQCAVGDGGCKCTQGDTETASSEVDILRGRYFDDAVDLSVRTPLGQAEVKRYYYDNAWQFNHDILSVNVREVNLATGETYTMLANGSYRSAPGAFEGPRKATATAGWASPSPISYRYRYAYKDGVNYIEKIGLYNDNDTQKTFFAFKNLAWIYQTEYGFRWEDKKGNWSTHNNKGKILTAGDRNGLKLSYSYDPSDNATLTGVFDGTGSQVFWYAYTDGRLTSVHDADGREVLYEYTSGLLSRVVDVLGNGTSYTYNAKGKLATKTDAEGRAVTITHDGEGRIRSIADAGGARKTFTYDYIDLESYRTAAGSSAPSGSFQSAPGAYTKRGNTAIGMTTPLIAPEKKAGLFYARVNYSSGREKEKWFNDEGKLVRTDINGRTVQKITYDGRTAVVEDENGNKTAYEFDEWENVKKTTYPDGSVETIEYDLSLNKPVQKIDTRGIVSDYSYDAAGNLTELREASGTSEERITRYTYDAAGNRLTETILSRNGDNETTEALTAWTYYASGDYAGNIETITDPESNVTQFTSYDAMGNVLTRRDGNNRLWSSVYDDAGNIREATDPLNNTTQIFYDRVDNKTTEIDPEGRITRYAYDCRNRVIRTTRVSDNGTDNATVQVFYDSDGHITKKIDAENRKTTYEYDLDGRLEKETDGRGNTITYSYEGDHGSCTTCSGGADKPKRVTYPTFIREYTYDSRDRMTAQKDIPDNGTDNLTTEFAYDVAGNRISSTDREQHETSYGYDSLSRLVQVQDPLGHITAYTYDARGNLLGVKDADNQTTLYEYDGNSRLVKETRPLGQETSYVYDAAGRLTQKIDAKGQKIEYTYDDAGRLEETNYYETAASSTAVKTVEYTYDDSGRLTGWSDGTLSGAYGYDGLGRKITESVDYGDFEKTCTYGYYRNGLKKSMMYPDNSTYRYSYDEANGIAGVTLPDNATISWNGYTWTRPSSVLLPGGTKRSYTYDGLMRMKAIEVKDPLETMLMQYGYGFDNMDNIVSKQTERGDYSYRYDDLYRLINTDDPTVDNETFTYDAVGNRLSYAGWAAPAGSYSYNANNELQTTNDATYDYDANGNTISRTEGSSVVNFIYDIENRLIRVEDGSSNVIAQYAYDPFGRRLSKTVDSTTTYYFYADEGLIGEYDATGTQIKAYGYKPGSTWTTDPLFMKQGTTHYYYQNDHLGTPQQITTASADVVWSATYSSFGKATVDITSSLTNNLRFPGQYYDEETGMHYNWNRYYEPGVGRYVSADPIGLRGGINLFSYVLNNAIRLIDPTGLRSKNPSLCSAACVADFLLNAALGAAWPYNPLEFQPFELLTGDIPLSGVVSIDVVGFSGAMASIPFGLRGKYMQIASAMMSLWDCQARCQDCQPIK